MRVTEARALIENAETKIEEPQKNEAISDVKDKKEQISESLEARDTIDETGVVRDLLNSEVKEQKLPSDSRVIWEIPEQKGNCDCCLRDNAKIRVNGKDVSGKDFKEHMIEKYGTDRVSYSHREPDFKPFEQAFCRDDINSFLKYRGKRAKVPIEGSTIEGHVTLEHMDIKRQSGTYKEASSEIAKKFGINATDIDDYMRSKQLTWHECGDLKTVRAIPSEINQVFGHTGGIGIEKDRRALRQTLIDAFPGFDDFILSKETDTGNIYVKAERLNEINEERNKQNKENKRNEF